MKKLLFSTIFFVSMNAFALDQGCISHIEKLEDDLQNCTVTYGDNATTSDMNIAVYSAADCAVKIAHQLFYAYYTNNAKESKEMFDNFVRHIYQHSHLITHHSDYAKENYTGTLYNSMAISRAESMIQDLTKSYLMQLKSECQEFLDK